MDLVRKGILYSIVLIIQFKLASLQVQKFGQLSRSAAKTEAHSWKCKFWISIYAFLTQKTQKTQKMQNKSRQILVLE